MDEQHHRVTADRSAAGERLDRFLAAAVPDLSRSRLKGLIEAGRVTVESTPGASPLRDPAAKVKAGQTFAIVVPESRSAEPEAQPIWLDIIHEDADLIVLNKPAGMVVHPAPGNPDRTLVNALIAHCGPALKGIGGVRRPGIVHRLDKDTSGLMVAAKTEAAHQGLVQAFAERRIERAYHALVWGRPNPKTGEITGNIGRSPRNRKKMAVLTRGGRAATTRYRVLEGLAKGAVSLVECRLLTGRTHQIRVHLSHRGHPLLGDPLYGRGRRHPDRRLGAAVAGLGRQALHAKSLGFEHPVSGKALHFDSALPTDIRCLITCLEELK